MCVLVCIAGGGVRNALTLVSLLFPLASGCESPPEPIPPSEPVAELSNEFAVSGIDRLIPVRVVVLCDTGESLPSGTTTNVHTAMMRANFAFKPAGVQFYVSRIESPQTPTLNTNEASTATIAWSSVSGDFQKIFPAATSSSFTGISNTVRDWYRLAAEKWGDESELFLYVTKTGGGLGRFPFEARDVEVSRGMLDLSPQLAHEFGHFLGVGHPFDIAASPVIHPETGDTLKLADWWDLTYIQDAQNNFSFPANRSDALAAEQAGTLYRINNNEFFSGLPNQDYCKTRGYGYTPVDGYNAQSNCCHSVASSVYNAGNSPGLIECSIGRGPYNNGMGTRMLISTGDAGMKGMSFTTSEGSNPTTSYRYGVNVMDYLHGNRDYPSQLSQSQARMVRSYLRFEVPLTDTLFSGMGTKSSRRTRLGRSTPRRPAYRLDFDGDGKRDIAFWVPPTPNNGSTSKFKIYLSSSSPSYSAPVEIAFGQLGDIPVPADYNEDGKTDIAVYRPGFGRVSSEWHYCLTGITVAGTTCSTYPAPIAFGAADTIPVQDTNFLTGPELAIYKPSTGEWKWRSLTSSSVATVQLGNSSSTILPGLYDNDDRTDLAVYDPNTAEFSLKLSSNSWAGAPLVRAFPSTYVASLTGGTPADRSGAVAIPGMYHRRQLGSYANGNGWWGSRLALTLWDPQSGNWASMWDPTLNANITTCQWGDPSDIPVPSLGLEVNGPDLSLPSGLQPTYQYNKLAVFRPSWNGNGFLYLKDSMTSGCGGTTPANQGLTPFNYQIFSVSDMDGDQLPEVWQYVNDQQKLYSYSSSSGYTTYTFYNLGGNRGYLL